jgi:hypothetical protein
LEEGLLLYIKKMNNVSFLLQLEAVEADANRILTQNHDNPEADPEEVGEKWSSRFLKRHPKFSIHRQETLDIARFRGLQSIIIQVYFQKLSGPWDKYNIHPEDCYNMDGTGYQIGIRGKQKIVTKNA